MKHEAPAALEANGWSFYEKCRCSNIMKYKYRSQQHKDLELEWWVKYRRFRIMYRAGTTKVGQTDITQLDKILKGL